MISIALELWDMGLHLPPRLYLSEVTRAVQLEQILFQAEHNTVRFLVSWQLGRKYKATTTFKLRVKFVFTLGSALHPCHTAF